VPSPSEGRYGCTDDGVLMDSDDLLVLKNRQGLLGGSGQLYHLKSAWVPTSRELQRTFVLCKDTVRTTSEGKNKESTHDEQRALHQRPSSKVCLLLLIV
jgi:hypothetical protein